jgi:glutamine phosphoribosylpyrophosphate amidotransferase
MCGLVGLAVNDPKEFDIDLLIRMSLEAQIRGQHACGIAILNEDGWLGVKTASYPVDQLDWSELENYKICAAIVHTRYSTSSLEYNQPMYIERAHGVPEVALIHNGVVTQADPSQWESLFNVKCTTRNDSEILTRLYREGQRHPLALRPSSQACIVLDSRDQSCRFWRNEERPLYFVQRGDSFAIASTKDILVRSKATDMAGLTNPIVRTDPGVEYCLSLRSFILSAQTIYEYEEDLQP